MLSKVANQPSSIQVVPKFGFSKKARLERKFKICCQADAAKNQILGQLVYKAEQFNNINEITEITHMKNKKQHFYISLLSLAAINTSPLLADTAKELTLQQNQSSLAQNLEGVTTYAYNNLHTHWLYSFSDMRDNIELEDGSQWSISPNDQHKLYRWRPGDCLVITRNNPWYKKPNHLFFINNETTKEHVRANLVVGPFAFGEYTYWVEGIDRYNGHIFLVNGQGTRTSWCVGDADLLFFDDWAVNDTIVIGVNDTWFTSHPSLLINVNMASMVMAKQI